MSILQHGKCLIQHLNQLGRGIGYFEGQQICLPYVLPDEEISFLTHHYRRKVNYTLEEILKPSPERINPICKYFTQCGGCVLQHLSKKTYINFKQSIIINALKEYQIQTNLLPLITVTPHKRRRANLEAVKKEDKLFMGFHKLLSHKIVDIDECPALLPSLSVLLPKIKELLFSILSLRQKAKIFLTQASNGIDITFEFYGQKNLTDNQKTAISHFAEKNKLIRVMFRAKKFIDIVYKKEEPFVIFGNTQVPIDAYCFLQATFESDNILQDLILKHASGEKGIDLFCGRGTLTLPLAEKFAMDGFESDKKAVEALKQAANNINISQQDLFISPIPADKLNKYDFAIINPPRCGAESQILHLARSDIQKIIYISCNPLTFARDAQILTEQYSLDLVQGIDQFYWSHHVEIFSVFSRLS